MLLYLNELFTIHPTHDSHTYQRTHPNLARHSLR